jgi:hypothetical protein
LLPCHEGAKQDTIGVVKSKNAKLPHCIGFALAYTMENKMPLIHHTINWWGYDCIIKDNKGLNERT